MDAFISHMGPSNHSGHYVCHIRDKQDPSKWVIFNDNKVLNHMLRITFDTFVARWLKVQTLPRSWATFTSTREYETKEIEPFYSEQHKLYV